MRKSFFTIVILLISQSSVSAQPGYYGTTGTTGQGPYYFVPAVNVNLDSLMLDSAITAHQNKYSVVGIASMIVRDGKVIWDNNYGYRDRVLQLPVDDSTIFDIGSISKTFVATSVMQLVQQGVIDLNANIDSYLPTGLTVSNPYFPGDIITMKMLLTHTSSLGADGSSFTPLNQCGDSPVRLDSFFVEYLTPGGKYYNQENFYNYRPGTNWHYCNVDLALAALAVEHVAGKPFYEYCQDSIFLPLSMNSSSWFLAETNQADFATPYVSGAARCHMGSPIYPAGELKTNKLDMAKYLLAYIDCGKSGEVRLLDSSTVSAMISDQVGYTSDYQPPWWRLTQGLTWYQLFPINSSGWAAVGSVPGALNLVVFDPQEKWFTIWFQNYRPVTNELGNIAEINNVFTAYAHLYGNVYAVRPSVNKPYAPTGEDSAFFRTEFSNIYNHQFTAHLIYCNADSTVLDSIPLSDDGKHGDILSGDGVYGGYIPAQLNEEFFSLSVSTILNSTNRYFVTPNIGSFTTAGPVTVDSVKSVPHPGYVDLKPYVTNHSESATISGATVKIYCYDPWVTTNSTNENPLPTMAPGAHVSCTRPSTLTYDESLAPDPLEFNLQYEILKDGWPYWIKTRVSERSPVPTSYRLEQNYPNPFNPTTNIRFGVPSPGFVVLKVYDVLGREVKTLVNEKRSPGTYEVKFDASGLSSGVYFYRIKAGAYTSVKKMLMLK